MMNKFTKQTWAWIVYDVANAIFSALAVGFIFPIYIQNFLGGSEFQIGLIVSIALLLVAITTPFLGALTDILGNRSRIHKIFAILVPLFLLLVSIPVLPISLIAMLFALFCFHNAIALYGATMTSIAPHNKIGMVAGLGVSLGSLGTMVAIGIFYFISLLFGNGNAWENKDLLQMLFIVDAVLFFILIIPYSILIKDKISLIRKIVWREVKICQSIKKVLLRLKATIGEIKQNKSIGWFYIGEFFYNNSIISLNLFLVLFAQQELKLSLPAFGGMYIGFLFVGVISSLITGWIVDKVGPKRVQITALVFWLAIIIGLIFSRDVPIFIALGTMGGIATGMLVSADRPMMVALAPREQIGKYFGFDEIVGRFSGSVGPFFYGLLISLWGYSAGLFLLFVFMVLSLFFIGLIKIKKAY